MEPTTKEKTPTGEQPATRPPDTRVELTAPISVQLERTTVPHTLDEHLWKVIRTSSGYIGFDNYKKFVDAVMVGHEPPPLGAWQVEKERVEKLLPQRSLPFPRVDGYRLLKVATEVFLMTHCGVTGFEGPVSFGPPPPRQLPQHEAEFLDELWPYLVPVSGASNGAPRAGGDGGATTTNGTRVAPDKPVAIPYLQLIRDKLGEVPVVGSRSDPAVRDCYFILQEKLAHPVMVELLHEYWLEESMLVQALNVISRRFQNRRVNGGDDPLANLDLDPLRPLANILWGFVQDEQHRLTVVRRAYEYSHSYGFMLHGKAVQGVRPAEVRSKFLEAFHNLLHRAAVFYKTDDNTTVKADAFPVLNALKDVHFVLAEGANNQFGDLPTVARSEMLMYQWLLARPEIREFLGGRVMVPYPEPWMGPVQTLRAMMGWGDDNVIHFHELATYGEQLLLSIRYGDWSRVDDMEDAARWAREFRLQVFQYVHSYRAVTGVDLSDETAPNEIDARPPSEHLRRRLEAQQAPRRLPPMR